MESFELFWNGLTAHQAFGLCVIAGMIGLTAIEVIAVVIKHYWG